MFWHFCPSIISLDRCVSNYKWWKWRKDTFIPCQNERNISSKYIQHEATSFVRLLGKKHDVRRSWVILKKHTHQSNFWCPLRTEPLLRNYLERFCIEWNKWLSVSTGNTSQQMFLKFPYHVFGKHGWVSD